MRKICVSVAVLACAILCGGAGVDDIAKDMDSSAPKFDTEGCQTAREKALAYDNAYAPRLGIGLALGLILGPFGLPLAVGMDIAKGDEATDLFNELMDQCGDDALAPWFQQQAEKGNATSEAWIAQFYAGRKDYEKAALWYRKSAEYDFVAAENNLGTMYYLGQGVDRDYAQAALWWRKAANHDVPQAETNLGNLYSKGIGVPADFKEARKWFDAAARRGHASGQAGLAKLFISGSGMPQNFLNAYVWYRLAAENGDDDAAAARDEAAAHLSEAELKNAEAVLKLCKITNYRSCPF